MLSLPISPLLHGTSRGPGEIVRDLGRVCVCVVGGGGTPFISLGYVDIARGLTSRLFLGL